MTPTSDSGYFGSEVVSYPMNGRVRIQLVACAIYLRRRFQSNGQDDQAGDSPVGHLVESRGPGKVRRVQPQQDQPVQGGPDLGSQVLRLVGGVGDPGCLAAPDGRSQGLEGGRAGQGLAFAGGRG